MAGVAEVPVETVDDDMDLVAGDAEETFDDDDGPFVDDGDGQLLIPGTGSGLSLKVTGKKPTTSTLKLTGGKFEVDGQYDKGDRLLVTLEVLVNGVGFKDSVDVKTTQITQCTRLQEALITGQRGVERLGD
jgi:hypothetical protein